MKSLHIITPVKNSADTAVNTIRSICASVTEKPFNYTVYNDFSNEATTAMLEQEKQKLGFELVHLSELTDHPSPNYLLVLQIAQQKALEANAHLVVIESDVVVKPDTLQTLADRARTLENPGMMAAVTTNQEGELNFPYRYARNLPQGSVKAPKGISFCCSLLSNDFLKSFDFHHLDPEKTWYDVFISHKAAALGFTNYVLTDTKVLHFPHSSRPWKKLKTSNPIKYYWRKFITHRERI